MLIQLYLDSYSYKKLLGTLVPNCKKCGSDKLRKDGRYKEFQQYKCKDCGFRFSFTSDLPKRRANSKIIEFAINLYITTGISLRKLARKILKFFKVKISYEAIRLWIKAFRSSEIAINEDILWHADETSLRIKGKIHWLWLVINDCKRTIIAWQISKDRDFETAKSIMLKAKEKAGTPGLIITDGCCRGIAQKIISRSLVGLVGNFL